VQSENFAHDSFATALARIAGGQHGLLRTHELHLAGLDNAAITRWVRAAKLHRKSRGIYTLGHHALSREGEFLAAVFAGGARALLAHDAAEELYGLRRRRAAVIDVVLPRKRVPPEGVRFHQARRLDPRDGTVYKGIPVTTIPRLLVDLATRRTDDELANVIHEAHFRGWFDERRVREAMTRAKGRTLKPLERALELRKQGSAGTKSRAERAMRARLKQKGIDALPNVTVEGFEVDLHVPGTKTIVEVDGHGHGRPRTQEDDALRDEVLTAAGFEVIRVPATRPGCR
jgi:very-short-patch-repair endonuclease